MILQALTNYYARLVEQGELEQPGWSPVKISYVLELGDEGEVENVVCVRYSEQVGKKTVVLPATMTMPAPVKRSSGIAANFLADNSSYILGVDNKGKPKRALECFEACRELHRSVLDGIEEPPVKALLNFFENWKPSLFEEDSQFAQFRDDVVSGVNLTFRYQRQFINEIDCIRQAWTKYYNRAEEGPKGTCLVTGQYGALATLHPSIKGVMGAQSSGASLVSFNAPAFCSYGKEQGMNAPTGSYAAFAYGAALNYLLTKQKLRIGDTTVLMWAENGDNAYIEMMGDALDPGAMFSEDTPYSEQDLLEAMRSLAKGKIIDFHETRLDPNMNFYILGIAPNAARLSVRFFMKNNFGKFLSNIVAHHDRMNIVRPKNERFETVSIKDMLDETVNRNSRDKSPKPGMAGEVLRAVLNDTRYPASLLLGMNLRIRADRTLYRNRAAILKAFYLKNTNINVPKEVLTVALNQDSTNVAYNLGRLFSVLEGIQTDALGRDINTTIKDKYFSSASATPGVVFPVLIKLAQKHLAKLQTGLAITRSREMQEIMSKLEEAFPAHLNLAQQGAFQLGYYHQTQYRYTKKEDK